MMNSKPSKISLRESLLRSVSPRKKAEETADIAEFLLGVANEEEKRTVSYTDAANVIGKRPQGVSMHYLDPINNETIKPEHGGVLLSVLVVRKPREKRLICNSRPYFYFYKKAKEKWKREEKGLTPNNRNSREDFFRKECRRVRCAVRKGKLK